MQSHLTSLLTWTANNDMQINTSKTKKWPLALLPRSIFNLFWPHQVQLNASPHSNYWRSTLTQTCPGPHTLTVSPQKLANGSISSSSSREREFLINSFFISITAVIRPVLEYAVPAWRHLINRTQAQHLESVKKRAIHIIFSFTRGMSYPNVVANLESLETRRNNHSRSFFKIFGNQPLVFIISFHLPKIPLLPLG